VELWADHKTAMFRGNPVNVVVLHCQWGSKPGVHPILVTKPQGGMGDAAYARVLVFGKVTTIHKTKSEWKKFWASFNNFPIDALEEEHPVDDESGKFIKFGD
jgi:hypothetical protein